MAHEPTQDGRTSNRGFASMNQERQRQIASMGGKAVPDEKRSFSQNPELAAEAGRKGGQASHGGGASSAAADAHAKEATDRQRSPGGSGEE